MLIQKNGQYKSIDRINLYRDADFIPTEQDNLINLVEELNGSNLEYCKDLDELVNNDHSPQRFTVVEEKGRIRVVVYDEDKSSLQSYGSTAQMDNSIDLKGCQGYRLVQRAYKKARGNYIYDVAGTVSKEVFDELRNCAPSTLVWIDEAYKSTPCHINVVEGFNKADISSAYASAFRILDNINWIKVEGYHTFNEVDYSDYDVAFYPDTHNVAVKGEFDSRELIDSRWAFIFNVVKKKGNPNYGKEIAIKGEDSSTYFFRFYKPGIESVIQDLYDMRSSNPEIKSALNVCIGYMYSDNNHKHPVVDSIVTYWTHINKMLKAAEEIEVNGGRIIQFATDCIGWVGKNVPIGSFGKKLGEFHIEHINSKAVFKACGVYAIEDEGEITVAHQGTHLTLEELRYCKEKIENIICPMTDIVQLVNIVEDGKPHLKYIKDDDYLEDIING